MAAAGFDSCLFSMHKMWHRTFCFVFKLYHSIFSAIFAFFPSDFRGNTLHHYGYMYAHLFCSMFSVDFVFVLSGIVVGIEEYTGDFGDKRTVRYALRHSIHSPLKQTRCITYENDLSVVTTSHDSTFSINQHNAKF